ncbi:MAG: ADP-ribosylglycohydrolase family protein [Sphingomonadaceae bacterium]|uniref:ADP-ribosylglycohydrolase family protein n=1 Tax=Thermaurantiacus sp. TaxID=2820283 RepID=UPI00298F3D2C|nr:ADP-ribosylglycohydrolase family protein [Thermaurantiacus sp.]MCS6986297.1 ADP-ribosylglycohydrolase family protein [Sphingomonadaceae bacterium]MDW8415746.1 ADP-ribosylglycohydrolase family protein [Thermaurantiacus sp.]
MTDDTARDRAVGALLGLAVGDALGTTLEFAPRDVHPPLTDMVGGGPFRLAPGEWTDDTSMALALAESLRACGRLDPHDLMTRFVAWWRRGEYSHRGSCFDIGNTTRAALARFERTGDPIAGSRDPSMAGNGSLMRLAPVAIRFWRSPDELDAAAALQSRTTHGAQACVDACRGYARMLAAAIAGRPRDDVLAPDTTGLEPQVARILEGSWRGKTRAAIQASGFVLHALEAALWSVGGAVDFRDAVLRAANLAQDADTTAAIAGQLAGALWGAAGIPSEWRAQVAWGPRIEELAAALFAAS